MTDPNDALEELARVCGVQTSYTDVTGRVCRAGSEALVRVLRGLGAPIDGPQDAAGALRAEVAERWARVLEPTTVHLEGRPGVLELRLVAGQRKGPFRLTLRLEEGGTRVTEGRLEALEVREERTVDGRPHARCALPLPDDVPIGTHRVFLELGTDLHEAWLLRAPPRLHLPDDLRTWGAFVPTYALRSEQGPGVGRLTDLARFANFVESLGGGVVGTLPLMAAFLDEPYDPSPYAPVSRLAWNELFLDVTRVPEWDRSDEARALLGSGEWQHAIDEMRRAGRVDYRRQWVHLAPLLDRLADAAYADAATRAALAAFADDNPHLEGYARFRAVMAAQGRPWGRWPEPLRDGPLGEDDGDAAVHRRHLYAQWRLSEQLDALCAGARRNGPGLYLDMPLGVHPDGYDAWAFRDSFMPAMAAGAPPDDFFVRGQNWGFAPLHPRRIRERGYAYLTASVRNQLARAGMLRIDHVMGLHRLFFVPDGMEATDGVYVRYRPEEMYAVLAIESQRHRSVIVGEDLGTVPDEVREAMADKAVLRMYVLQYEVGPDRFGAIPRDCIASANTHDMAPFAAWWKARDVDDRVTMGYLDPAEAEAEREGRARTRDHLRRELDAGTPGAEPDQDVVPALRASLEHLAASPARMVLVNLEDLWLEEGPQNVPGTGRERPNWVQKARLTLEALREDDAVITQLKRIDERRRAT